jgi:RNA polymerase sigma-70 factor (ECF subfamily)
VATAVGLTGVRAVEPASSAAEDALVAAAVSRPEAFGALYERYMPRVYRYLRTRTASADEAADVTQAVFVKAMSSLSQYRPGRAPFAGWLFRIARNAAVDAHRRRRPSVTWDELPESIAESSADSPEDLVLRRERIDRLRMLVARLDTNKRELLALRFAASLTSREIAAVVGKGEGAVKKQLFRIIASLKEQYFEQAD